MKYDVIKIYYSCSFCRLHTLLARVDESAPMGDCRELGHLGEPLGEVGHGLSKAGVQDQLESVDQGAEEGNIGEGHIRAD